MDTNVADSRQLAQEHRLFASAINNLSAGVVITRPDEQQAIVFVNPSFTQITGYSADEALGRNCRFLQGPETEATVVAEIREAIAERRPFRGLIRNYRKDGTPFMNGLVITPVFDDDGNLQNYVGLLNDVSAPREQLRALAARLTQVREEERTQMAREIHDVLGQALTGLKMDLAVLSKRVLQVENEDVSGALRDKITAMGSVVDDTIRTVRRISTELRPSILDDLGLEAAAEWQVGQFQERSGIECHFLSNLEDLSLDAESSTALFRILQETLTNVARHAHATRVEITLAKLDDEICLEVHDDGRGITQHEATSTQTLGLLGMRERASLVNGVMEINGSPGEGTTVSVSVPYREKADYYSDVSTHWESTAEENEVHS
jgi:PAS domain S-box-containing protein